MEINFKERVPIGGLEPHLALQGGVVPVHGVVVGEVVGDLAQKDTAIDGAIDFGDTPTLNEGQD